jgi:hypothetical protein
MDDAVELRHDGERPMRGRLRRNMAGDAVQNESRE